MAIWSGIYPKHRRKRVSVPALHGAAGGTRTEPSNRQSGTVYLAPNLSLIPGVDSEPLARLRRCPHACDRRLDRVGLRVKSPPAPAVYDLLAVDLCHTGCCVTPDDNTGVI
jgi:hypothetical protein